MTQMKAKLFNEENLIKEKMRKLTKESADKVVILQQKIQQLQSENVRLKRESAKQPRPHHRKNELFPGKLILQYRYSFAFFQVHIHLIWINRIFFFEHKLIDLWNKKKN